MFAFKIRSLLQAAALTVAMVSNLAHAGLANTASVYMNSEPGDYIGQGQEFTLAHGDDGVFSTYSGSVGVVSINYQTDDYWNFSFIAPAYDKATNTVANQPLHVGMYENATRYPFNSPTKPGLSVSGAGRGSNILFGWFNVLEVTYLNGELNSFAVDFMQYSGQLGAVGPALYGSLRFNSDLALNIAPVPEPSTYAMLLAGLALVTVAARRARKNQQ